MLSIFDMTFDAAGHIALYARNRNDQLEVVLMEPQPGGAVKEIPIPLDFDDHHHLSAAWASGSRWVIIRSGYDEKTPNKAFWFDTDTAALTPIPGLDCPSPGVGKGVFGTSDGGFIVVGDYRSREMASYGPDGALRWKVPSPGPQDVVALPDGGVAYLTVVFNVITVLDARGQEVRKIELDKTLGYRPDYVTTLALDQPDGWILEDFGAQCLVYHLAPDGQSRRTFHCKFADGRVFTPRGLRRGPDGHIWTSDGAAIYRLDDQGVVDLVLGRGPEATASIGEIRTSTIDDHGRIYALDNRNGVVHVFDPQGRRLRILKPDPSDFPANSSGMGTIAVAGDGSVYVMPDTIAFMGGGKYLKFTPDGARAGFEPRLINEVHEEWVFRPGGQERVIIGYERAWLLNAPGDKKTRIERRADRRWLERVERGAVAADGSFAIVASPMSGWTDGSPSVTIFSPQGDPVRTLDLPPRFGSARVACTDRFACVLADDTVILLDARTGDTHMAKVPGFDRKSWLYPYAAAGGHELWIFNPKALTVEKYSLPES